MLFAGFEFRFSMFFGLAAILATWFLIGLLALFLLSRAIRLAQTEDAKEKLKVVRQLARELFMPVAFLIATLWTVACAWTGYRITDGEKEFIGTIKPTPIKKTATGRNNPSIKSDELLKSGDALQEAGAKDLDDFRKKFFNKEKK